MFSKASLYIKVLKIVLESSCISLKNSTTTLWKEILKLQSQVILEYIEQFEKPREAKANLSLFIL